MDYFVGVDVGGTTTTVAIGNQAREVLHISDQFPTLSGEGPHATIRTIVDHVVAGLEGLGATIDQVPCVSLATPGPATLDGVLLKTPNLGDSWDKFAVREELEKAFQALNAHTRVRYIGDGQAAALGEYSVRTRRIIWDGVDGLPDSPENLASLFLLTVGTGLGGGEVRDGKVVRGSAGRAGHGGHLLLPHYAFRYEHDRSLLVGNALCTVESAVSLTALTHQLSYRLTLPEWREHPLNQSSESTRNKAKRLRELAKDGDALALQLFDDQACALGIGFLNANYIGDFDLLVIGGGVCDLAPAVRDRYWQIVEDTYRKYALDGFKSLFRIEFSVCRDNASVIGSLTYTYEE